MLELLPCEQGTIRLRRLGARDAADYARGAEDDLVRRFGHLPLDRYTPEVVRQQIDDVIDPGLRAGTLAVLATVLTYVRAGADGTSPCAS